MDDPVRQVRQRASAVRPPVALGAALAAVSVGCCLAAVLLGTGALGGADPGEGPARITADDVVLATVWPVAGAFVVRAQPRNPVGWLLLCAALIGPYQLLAVHAARTGGEGVLGAFGAWVAVWGFAPYLVVPPLLPHFFPDGRLPGPRWRPVVPAVLVVAAVTVATRMLSPVTSDIAPEVANPWGLEGVPWLRYVTLTGSLLLFFVGIPLAALSLAVRTRRARALERTQLQWLFLGVLLLVATILIPSAPLALGLLGPPLGIGVAMLRHGLFDVELTLNRTLVFGLLTALVLGVYGVVVYGVQAVAPGSRWGVALVAVTALGVAAGRGRVQSWVDRWLFGHRHNPYAVVSHVGRHVAAATAPLEALQGLLDGLREALRLPYAAFTAEGMALASGSPLHGSRVVPVQALGATVGELHVGLRAPRERWSAEQLAAVQEVAARAGTLAYAADLVADVARSRERIVAAREEERRRLRADLHDGVAPSLAGTALQLESLATRLADEGGDEALAGRIRGLRDDLRGTVAQLRDLVHGLRPPVLDQRGLAGALRQLLLGHDTPECAIHVDDLGTPPAAVEVAAYAIAAEACANALRHSSASRLALGAHVADGTLVVEVVDNGVGLPHRLRAGVGMVSMRERAAEVGGRLELAETPGGGTTVRALLPWEVA